MRTSYPKKDLTDMRKEPEKYDSKLLDSLMEALNHVKEEKRSEYVDSLFLDIEQTMESTKNYAKSKNVDYETALERIMAKKTSRLLR